MRTQFPDTCILLHHIYFTPYSSCHCKKHININIMYLFIYHLLINLLVCYHVCLFIYLFIYLFIKFDCLFIHLTAFTSFFHTFNFEFSNDDETHFTVTTTWLNHTRWQVNTGMRWFQYLWESAKYSILHFLTSFMKYIHPKKNCMFALTRPTPPKLENYLTLPQYSHRQHTNHT